MIPIVVNVRPILCELFSEIFFSGIFFVLPCIESYQKVDLRTITLGVPPQEVRKILILKYVSKIYIDGFRKNLGNY